MKLYVSAHIWLCCSALLAGATRSGFYVDNGLDQTEIQRGLSEREQREVEHGILHLLGIPRRPRAVPVAGSAPKFLLDVYKSLLEPSADGLPQSEFNISGADLSVIDKSDVIMGFVSHSHHSTSVRHERGKRLWFDVSEVPVEETIIGAELRLYQQANSTVTLSSALYTITVYQLVDAGQGEELEYVSAVNTTADAEGWLLLNTTGPLVSWVAFPRTNLGLHVTVRPAHHPGHEIRPEDIGIVSSKGEEDRKPFMVAFFKSSNHRETHIRTTRETRGRRKSNTSHAEVSHMSYPFIDNAGHSSRSCQMKMLYVNFRDLQWEDWIIAPEGFPAYYCSGECNFPLNAHMNATNHAIVQTLVHLMNPLQVPKPCCAPTKLGPIQLLYYLEDSSVTLKRYKNMVVKSCGCH
ncbi:protein 60A [Anabrus simplex]|uniref:protein 60A n=1 Tax=Anabrus simplex TaxID=316456 RepID=UPI0035A32E30